MSNSLKYTILISHVFIYFFHFIEILYCVAVWAVCVGILWCHLLKNTHHIIYKNVAKFAIHVKSLIKIWGHEGIQTYGWWTGIIFKFSYLIRFAAKGALKNNAKWGFRATFIPRSCFLRSSRVWCVCLINAACRVSVCSLGRCTPPRERTYTYIVEYKVFYSESMEERRAESRRWAIFPQLRMHAGRSR